MFLEYVVWYKHIYLDFQIAQVLIQRISLFAAAILNSCSKNMFYGKINVRNEFPMAELVKIDLLLVKIALQIERGIGAHL